MVIFVLSVWFWSAKVYLTRCHRVVVIVVVGTVLVVVVVFVVSAVHVVYMVLNVVFDRIVFSFGQFL